MKRFHIHVAVEQLDASIRFYSTLFGTAPTVSKPDYAKWMLDDPRVNFALSKRTFVRKAGVNHLGVQAETDAELQDIHARLIQAGERVVAEQGVECCYAKSEKYWAKDPQGLAWETFRSVDTVEHYYGDEADASATGVSLLNKQDTGCSSLVCAVSKARSWFGKALACCQ